MAENFNVTSADMAAVLTVEGVFPQGIDLQMFGADTAYSADAVDIAETRMGVDGKMVAGYTPSIFSVTITLEAASPSRESLCTVWEAMQTNRTVYPCTLVITLPSLGEVHTLSNGVLKNGSPMPAAQKTLQPTSWTFDFASMTRAKL